jgi:hypothetical protein
MVDSLQNKPHELPEQVTSESGKSGHIDQTSVSPQEQRAALERMRPETQNTTALPQVELVEEKANKAKESTTVEQTAISKVNANRLYLAISGSGESPDPEHDIRDILRTHNSEQLALIAKQYRRQFGDSLENAILHNAFISPTTKTLSKIYLKGNDHQEQEDSYKLMNTAVRQGDLCLVAEVMSTVAQEVRQNWLKDGGDKFLSQTFTDDKDYQHALDAARQGKVETATQVWENTGTFLDNNKGIELAIGKMSDQERALYQLGEKFSQGMFDDKGNYHKTFAANILENYDNRPPELKDLTFRQTVQAVDYYESLHGALTKAGNSSEIIRWEDQISTKGGSLISQLTNHRGVIFNSKTSDISKDLETMSKEDWNYFKQHPERREDLLAMLESLGKHNDSLTKLMTVFDKKLNCDSYEQARITGGRPIKEALEELKTADSDRRLGVLQALENMNIQERQKYNSDSQFKRDVDDNIKDALQRARMQRPFNSEEMTLATQHMLYKISQGDNSPQDLITKLRFEKSNGHFDKAETLRQTIDELRSSSALREQLSKDEKFAQEFKATAIDVLGAKNYQTYLKPLMAGQEPELHDLTRLDKGFFSHDALNAIEDFAHAPEAVRKRLQEDREFQETSLGFLTKRERQVAMAAVAQGELKLEDKIRESVLGLTPSKELVISLKDLQPQQLEEARQNYKTKYSGNLDQDVLEEASSKDKPALVRALAITLAEEEKYHFSHDEYVKTRSGIGSALTDSFGSASGKQADDAMNRMAGSYAEANRTYQQVSPEKIQEIRKQLEEAIDNHKEVKEAAADAVNNTLIAGGSVAAVIATGGTGLPLVAALAVGGAATRIATKKIILGADYEMSAGHLALDASVGAVTAGTSALGPGELAIILKVGEQAAAKATQSTLSDLAVHASQGLLKEGGEQTLAKGTRDIMKTALSGNATEIDKAAVEKLAQNLVSDSLATKQREAAVKELSNTLYENLQYGLYKETDSYLGNLARQEMLNTGGGATGGAMGSAYEATTQWDSNKSLEDNLAHIAQKSQVGALAGGSGALVLGNAFRAGSKVAEGLSHALAKPQAAKEFDFFFNGQKLEPNAHLEFAAKDFPNNAQVPQNLHVTAKQTTDGKLEVTSHEESSLYFRKAYGDSWQKIKPEEKIQINPGDELRVGETWGPELKLTKQEKALPHEPSQGAKPDDEAQSKDKTVSEHAASAKETPEATTANKTEAGNETALAQVKPADLSFAGEKYSLHIGEEVTLGSNHQHIENKHLQAEHAILGRDERGVYIQDQRSGGETIVANPALKQENTILGSKHYLKPGDEVYLGGREGVKIEGLDDLPTEALARLPFSKPITLPEATGPAKRVMGEKGEMTVTPIKDGYMYQESDGGILIANNLTGDLKHYNQARLLDEIKSQGHTRHFEYSKDGQLTKMTSEDGSTIHKDEATLHWIQTSTKDNGKTITNDLDTGMASLDDNGVLTLKARTARPAAPTELESTQRKFYLDGTVDLLRASGRVDHIKANYHAELTQMQEAAPRAFQEKARLERFNKMQEEFEKEAVERGISQNDRALFYKQINRLLEENPAGGAALSAGERSQLAEQLLNHATHTRTVDQGANSTCNVTTVEVRTYARQPDKNAQIVADLALTGKYTTADGTVIDASKLENGIKPDWEARRNLARQESGWNSVKQDGGRDWASQLVQTTMINGHWQRRTPDIFADGELVPNGKVFYTFNEKGKVYGVSRENPYLYDKQGLSLRSYRPGQEIYNRAGERLDNIAEDNIVVIHEGRGSVFLKDKVKRVYDNQGRPPNQDIQPGEAYYDESGKLILSRAKPGDLYYDKIKPDSHSSQQERVLFRSPNGEVIPIFGEKGKVTSPGLGADSYKDISQRITGNETEIPFVLSHENGTGVTRIDNLKDLETSLERAQRDDNYPLVMLVNCKNEPFFSEAGLSNNEGGNMWHVINVWGYDKASGKVRFTNQWGSKADHMDDDALPIDTLHKAMTEPEPPGKASWRKLLAPLSVASEAVEDSTANEKRQTTSSPP